MPIRWGDWSAPVRAAVLYYISVGGGNNELGDDGYAQLLVAWEESWQAQPRFNTYYWSTEQGVSIPLQETNIPSQIVGKYHVAKYTIPRRYFYEGMAKTDDGPPIHGEDGQYVWNQKYHPQGYGPHWGGEWHQLLPVGQFGSEHNSQSISTTPGSVAFMMLCSQSPVNMEVSSAVSIDFRLNNTPSVDFKMVQENP